MVRAKVVMSIIAFHSHNSIVNIFNEKLIVLVFRAGTDGQGLFVTQSYPIQSDIYYQIF